MDANKHPGEEAAHAFLARCGNMLVDGQFVPAASGRTFPVINPATEQVIANVAHADAEDVDRAVTSARAAFDAGPWRRMTPVERARLIYRLADALESIGDEIALIETWDNGKPLTASRRIEVPVAVERLRYYSGWTTKLGGTTPDLSLPGEWHAYTLREPVGVAGLIVPWNFPLTMAVSKLAPALSAGCTVILKPAEQTPLSALRLGELVNEIGFPPGVVNIVTGFGDAGAALVEHPGVNKISFTGSTEVGRSIVRAAAGNFKRVTLELGGKSPAIIFPDANLDEAIPGAARAIFFNAGQVCTAASRLYAHQAVFDRVLEGVTEFARKMKVAPGIDPSAEMGPLISEEHFARVKGYVDSGKSQGAHLVTGGQRLDRPGYFMAPTILAGTTADMAVRREEIFGPVLCATSFSDEGIEAIAAEANESIYGLMAFVWTQNLSVAHKMARRLSAGTVRVNGGAMDHALPFGGYKQSGWGRENGREGIDMFTEIKSVQIKL